MKKPWSLFTLLLISLLLASTAQADETQSGTSADPGVITKTGNAIEHGAKATVEVIEKGARATARGVKHGVKAAAHGVEKGANAVGNAAGNVARKVGINDSAPAGDSNADKQPAP